MSGNMLGGHQVIKPGGGDRPSGNSDTTTKDTGRARTIWPRNIQQSVIAMDIWLTRDTPGLYLFPSPLFIPARGPDINNPAHILNVRMT